MLLDQVAVADVIYNPYGFQHFLTFDLISDQLLGEATILNFRLQKNQALCCLVQNASTWRNLFTT